ncbi:MAG: phycobilisome rod-core linker polypeptide [Cyanobacteria bacterium P01_F01_bin.42]
MAMVSDQLALRADSSLEDVQLVIRAVYKSVLGNPHVMESERLTSAESRLVDGTLSVREFVRAVGQSDFYRARNFECSAPNRFVELNFMHFLGRPPQSQQEISEHIVRCVAEGYAAEIDSYIDSEEYLASFGENGVPYRRGRNTESGLSQVTYNRTFALDRGPAQVSSAVKSSQVGAAVAQNSTTVVKPSTATVVGSGTEKRLKIVVAGSNFDNNRRMGLKEYVVSASKMSPQIQRIHRSGSKIVSITEI